MWQDVDEHNKLIGYGGQRKSQKKIEFSVLDSDTKNKQQRKQNRNCSCNTLEKFVYLGTPLELLGS